MKRLSWLALLAAFLMIALFALMLITPVSGVRRVGPELVKLPDGTTRQIAAVTYGTNHVFGTRLGCWIGEPSSEFAERIKEILGPLAMYHRETATVPSLIVWLKRTGDNDIDYAVLSDENGIISGDDTYSFSDEPNIEYVEFELVPRRSSVITINFYMEDASPSRVGRLSFRNPIRGTYPEWKPEPLPATKIAGDVEVTLRSVRTGLNSDAVVRSNGLGQTVFEFSTNLVDGRNYTHCDLAFRSLSDTNQAWTVSACRISDGTGNEAVLRPIEPSPVAENVSMLYPSLWPEPAWRLIFQLQRVGGFSSKEQVTLTVPLGVTNAVSLETNCNGVRIAFESIVPLPSSPVYSLSAAFTHSAPADTRLDLVRVVTPSGQEIPFEDSDIRGGVNDRRIYYLKEIPAAAETANFVFVVQQVRTVEFTVKPEWVGGGIVASPK